MAYNYRRRLETTLNRDAVHARVVDLLPELAWRSGESELSNELMVTGTDELGFLIKFTLHEYEAGGSVRIAVDDEHPTGRQLANKIVEVVLPRLESEQPGPGETGPRPGSPPESESYAALLATRRGGPATPPPEWPPPVVPTPLPGIDRPSTGRPSHLPSRVGTRSGKAEVVIDLLDWLPGWGEDGVTLDERNLDLALEVEYDLTDNPDDGTAIISVVFEGAVYHCRYWAPSMMSLFGGGGEPEAVSDLGRTDLVRQITKASSSLGKGELREYSIWFQSSGVGFNVVAKDVRVE